MTQAFNGMNSLECGLEQIERALDALKSAAIHFTEGAPFLTSCPKQAAQQGSMMCDAMIRKLTLYLERSSPKGE